MVSRDFRIILIRLGEAILSPVGLGILRLISLGFSAYVKNTQFYVFNEIKDPRRLESDKAARISKASTQALPHCDGQSRRVQIPVYATEAALKPLRDCVAYVDLQRLFRPPGLFRPFGDTSLDRRPAAFGFVREGVGDGPERRILSIGCSTGEEVFPRVDTFPRPPSTRSTSASTG